MKHEYLFPFPVPEEGGLLKAKPKTHSQQSRGLPEPSLLPPTHPWPFTLSLLAISAPDP